MIKLVNKIALVSLIAFCSSISAQGLQKSYEQTQAINNANANAREKARRDEADMLFAATTSGMHFKCGDSKTYIFFKGRVFFESDSSVISGTEFNFKTHANDKVYYSINGEWIRWAGPSFTQELNQNTGRLFTQPFNEKMYIRDNGIGFCKRTH